MRRLRNPTRRSQPILHPPRAAAPQPAPPPSPPSKTRRVEVIVKLGGSALTDKTRPHTVHESRFAQAIESIAQLHHCGIGLILVHGAGSFGHFEAAHYDIQGGNASALGMSATHMVVCKLNALVVDALIGRGVPAVGVSALLVPGRMRVDFVATLLDRGHLPVLHGDACYGGDGRTVVLSGDRLVGMMAGAFEFVRRVVFVSDVDGVMERPPGEGGGRVVKKVTVDGRGEVCLDAEMRVGDGGVDVTGGIVGKVAAAGRCVAEGAGRITGFIVRVGSLDAERVMRGDLPEPWDRLGCTRVCFEEAGGESVEVAGKRRWFGGGG